jgi:peptidoglycan LD-endopeptidase LytH
VSGGATVRGWRRVGAWAAWCCSLRVSFALTVGAALALVPMLCGPSGPGVTLVADSPRWPHEAYAHTLAATRLPRDPAARAWVAAGERSLREPQAVALPFTESRWFAGDGGFARGYTFAARVGQRMRVEVVVDSASESEVYVDLFRAGEAGLERIGGGLPLTPGASRTQRPIELEVFEAGSFVLRVQPQASGAGAYDVRIAAGPLLAFPVRGLDTRAIQSGFGAERDGGRREHRGVDIFATRGTVALAATDGWVSRVETTRVGGNVVWLQPLFGNMRLYYAHLDTQLVQRGQFVLAGEPVGTVGNTGNAITTPPHLHFGVYVRPPGMRGGAQDPYGFLH